MSQADAHERAQNKRTKVHVNPLQWRIFVMEL